ncbi:MAG: hypothetical protein M1377_07225 [Deltaproteobacteria bacterium]|nr:hypothetical protein [Deltaproteobacteria bacterium]
MRIVSAVRPFLSVLFLSALPLLLHPAFSAPPPPVNPHGYFREPAQCPRCHLYTDSKLDPGRFSTSSVDFCLECHLAEERGRTHPLKVHPGSKVREVKIPPEFRLGDGEHIVCLTCHSAHGSYVSNVRAFAEQRPMNVDGADASPYYKTFFLRRSNPAGEGFEALCGGCHRTP